MERNEAVILLHTGYGFTVSAASAAGAGNYARLRLIAGDGGIAELGRIDPGLPAQNFDAMFSDVQLVISGFAGDELPSFVLPFQDNGAKVQTIYYDDAFGNDGDYNDLIVTITKVKIL